MKCAFILLFALFCYHAQHASSGDQKGGKGRKFWKLSKEISNLEEDVSCLMEEMNECKAGATELGVKISKMLKLMDTDCGEPSQKGYTFGKPQPNTIYCSTVKVECAVGYKTTPEKTTLKCQANGKWEEANGCTKIHCGTPSKEGYTFSDPDPDTRYESTVNVSCAQCYQGPPDKSKLTCEANGKWTEVSGCSKITCDPPNKEGYVFGQPNPDNTCGSTASVQCAAGFVGTPDKTTVTCKDDGSWEDPNGCERKDCGTPDKEGYQFTAPNPNTLYESTVNVSCADCYGEGPDNSQLTCEAGGNWTDVSGCNKKVCGSVPETEGYVFGDPNPDTTCGSTVSVTCADGYVETPDKPNISCLTNSSWETPSGCQRKDCGTPDKEGYEFSAPNPNTLFGSTVNVSCADCYGEGPDKSQLTCEADGNWTDVSGCNKKVCGSVPEKEGYVLGDPNPDTTCGSTVSVTCADGYVETPDKPNISCLANSSWETPSGCKNCGPWYMAYHHNATGSPISGSKADLINKVRNGANVRVMIERSNALVTSLQNAHVIGAELCAQALFFVSKSGYDKMQSNAYWWFVSVCTTGHWQMSRYNIGEHVSRGASTARYALKWFVREEGQSHLVTLNSTGDVESGSKSNVIAAIKKGHNVRVFRPHVSPADYCYPCDALEHSADESLAVCNALWSVSQGAVQRDGYTVFDITPNAYWWFTLQTTQSDLKMSRWHVGAHTQPAAGNSEVKRDTKWFADPCWRPVYTHDLSGQPISGSLVSLIGYIENGYRVKIQLKNLTLEADEIRRHFTGHICVSLLNDLYKSTIDTFAAPVQMSWVWRQCCTTGRCETMKYKVGANVETGGNTFEHEPLTWFVDTPRKWTHVLSVAKDETVTFGSKAALINAIRKGSEVRYNLIRTDLTQPDVLTGHLADNLVIEDNEVGAQHVRAITVQRQPLEIEVRFNPNPYWSFTVITTTGRLEKRKWKVGVHVAGPAPYSHKVSVDWFVNEAA